MTRFAALVTMTVLAVLNGTMSRLDAETLNCTPIIAVPTTITAQGVYCFTHNLATSMSTGVAILINVNNVVLDLNGYKLQGNAAGPATLTAGIVGQERRNVTVKNGTVRGFLIGIALNGTGHIVEDMRVDFSTQTGIAVSGVGSVVRNNVVVTTGGTTAFGPPANAGGIQVLGGLHRVLNNEVLDTFPTGAAFGTSITVGNDSQGVVVEHNRAGNSTLAATGQTVGLRVDGSNAVLVNNRFTLMTTAIICDGTGIMRDNLSIATGGTGSYVGCTNAGNNQ